MNKTPFVAGIACGVLLLAFIAVGNAQAQSPEDSIRYPVTELGNCSDKASCKAYCDDSAHMEACISFAEQHNLMPKEEIETAKKFIAAGAKGPGGCTGKDSCEAYCNDTSHIDACVAFAEENGLMSSGELQEAKKVQAAIKNGVKPPACGGKQACDAYCESPDHMPECIAFAKAAGLMSAEEAQNADKMLQAIEKGAKPPACRGKAECDAYCGQEEHFNECLEFGKAAGFMTEQEYEMAKKTGGKGPGGCKGKEECDAFCTSSPENEEVCMNFQEEKGLISEEQRRQMDKDKQQMKESFANMPSDVEQCIRERIGSDTFDKLKSGEQRVTRTIGDAMPSCFQKFEGQREAQENERRQQEMMRPPGSEGSSQYPQGPQGPYPREGQPPGPYPCEGDNCMPPPFEGRPEGQFQTGPNGPDGQIPPPCEGENCQPTVQIAPPAGIVAPVPQEGATEPPPPPPPPTATVDVSAPAPQMPQAEPTTLIPMEPTITPESLSGAVILFLHSFGRAK